jgi:transposase
LAKFRDSLFSVYKLEHTNLNVDTTSLSVYSKGEYGHPKQRSPYRFGYSRDKRPDLRQVNISVAELRDPINIPFHLTVEKGNTADSITFLDWWET